MSLVDKRAALFLATRISHGEPYDLTQALSILGKARKLSLLPLERQNLENAFNLVRFVSSPTSTEPTTIRVPLTPDVAIYPRVPHLFRKPGADNSSNRPNH